MEKIAATVLQVVDNVTLVGRPETFTDLPIKCLPDLRPGFGPLAGLETALVSSRADWGEALNVIVGCDMPGLQPQWLARLLDTARQNEALCVAAKDRNGKTQPLCAVYRTACLPIIQEALDSRRLRLLDLLKSLKAEELPVDEVIANVNTPDEWAAWQSQ